MPMNVASDAVDFQKKLEAAGMPAAQAEVQSKLVAEVLERWQARRRDLLAFERDLMTKFDTVSQHRSASVDRIDRRLVSLTWMLGTAGAIEIAIVLKLFVG